MGDRGKYGKGASRIRRAKQPMRPKRKGGVKHFKFWRAKGTEKAKAN